MTYFLTAECPVGSGSIAVEIEYNWIPGRCGDGPDAYHGPTPDEPDEVEYVGSLIGGVVDVFILGLIEVWCEDYLLGAGYDRACQIAREGGGE